MHPGVFSAKLINKNKQACFRIKYGKLIPVADLTAFLQRAGSHLL